MRPVVGFRNVTSLVLLCTAAGFTTLAAQGRALTIEDYYRVKTVGAPLMSPDGKWVTYTVSTRIEATNADSTEMWVASTDGTVPPRRVGLGAALMSPQWDRDGRLSVLAGRRLLIVDPTNPDSLVDPSTGRVRPGVEVRAERLEAAAGRPIASPDGSTLAFLKQMDVRRRESSGTRLSDFESRHEARFKGVQFDWLNFQRDGGPFPVPNRVDLPAQEIVIAATNGTDERQVTHLGLRLSGREWSPDGTMLLFTADSASLDERKYEHGQVYTVTRDGTLRIVTPDRNYDASNAHFSPDGRWILYERQLSTDVVIAQRLDHGGATDLVLVPVNGGAERNLTANWDYLPGNATWSPDGKYVYFTGGVGGAQHLFRVAAAGGDVQQVTRGERRILGISFDKAMSRMAYVVGLIEAPAEIYVANIDGSNERRITHVHDALTSEIAFSKAERLKFASKDGTPIEGWLYYPHGYQGGKLTYPLVVINHGGPHAADGYVFDFKKQLFAAHGYFVLMVNFRSSTGYGEKFLWGTWGAWGTKDGQDVMSGVDYVLQRFPIARNHVAVMGHSYGGFMTNWLITQYPDRFAAAIPGAGIVNWVSDYGTADIARTKETEFYGTPWDERARNIMIKQSPLTYANRVKAPTLFIHGEVDQRVPYSEAEQMFVALKKNGVPAKIIQYQGMPHSISGSWNVVHRMMNELRWLNTYLKTGV